MIRVNNNYLQLSPGTVIEMERQIKLFEELDTTASDFSYSFDFPATSPNLATLGFPFPNTANKIIYNDIGAEILDTDGLPIYSGKLRIENVNRSIISASFYSGNFNWLSLITGHISELDWAEYDADLSDSNIINNSVNTSGLIFPLVDMGALITRSTAGLKVEDFNGALYVKSIFNKIFYRAGIKYNGELTNDWLFQNMIITKNNKNADAINDRASYVKKTSNQTVVDSAAYAVIALQDDSTSPYFDGAANLFNTGTYRYTADVSINIKVDVDLVISMNTQLNSMWFRVNKNGSTYREYKLTFGPGASPPTTYNFGLNLILDAGDFIQIDVRSVDSFSVNTGVQTGSTIRITPTFIYKVFGNSLVPNWTKKDFVLSIINLFNVITDWNPVSQTVTFNLFEKLKSHPSTDISKYVDQSTIETEFTEFISSFAKKNYLTYVEGDDENLNDYNIKEFVKYGNGLIQVDNDFLEEEKNLIESGFTTPISYVNSAFNASMERINLVELENGDTTTFSSVTDSSGAARFNVASNYFANEELVRISESTHPAYNGDWIVNAAGGGILQVRGLSFNVTATGKITKMNFKYTSNDSVFILINIPDYEVSNFSRLPYYTLEGNQYTAFSYAYFNLLNVGMAVNTGFNQGLSFGEVNNPLSYQRTLIDTYWRSVQRVLNDPVKVKATCRFPKSVFKSLTPLSPVHLKSDLTSNMYYINRIRGYKKSYLPCRIELIKL